MNFKTFAYETYSVYNALVLKPTTLKAYLNLIEKLPDDWEIESISRTQIQLFINELAREHSSATVKHYFTVIKGAIACAHENGICDRLNELRSIRLPKKQAKIVNAISDEELKYLLPHILNDEYSDLFILLLNTGLRIGEALALDRASYNVFNNTLIVDKVYYKGELYQTTKSAAGVRTIPCNEIVTKLLKNKIGFGLKNPLFASDRGGRLSYNTVQRHWSNIVKSAKITKFGIHSLRHTFATQLLQNGVPLEVVSKLLGHKSIAITADIYTDITLKTKEIAVNTLNII